VRFLLIPVRMRRAAEECRFRIGELLRATTIHAANRPSIRALAIYINQPAPRQLPALMMNVRYKRNVMHSACTTRPNTGLAFAR